jgi:hypothetical protein
VANCDDSAPQFDDHYDRTHRHDHHYFDLYVHDDDADDSDHADVHAHDPYAEYEKPSTKQRRPMRSFSCFQNTCGIIGNKNIAST